MDISADVYLEHCKRRFGNANPDCMFNAVWEWMVRQGHGPYGARESLGLESDYQSCSYEKNPDWCFVRMGMPTVSMPDGREISVAGEHEDYYDPDFCIYNDVIVRQGNNITIYGYPRDLFPPTDFHTATLIGSEIWLIGSLGYAKERSHGATQVFALDTQTYQVRRVLTSGESPGWINGHSASLLDDGVTIEVCRGEILRMEDEAEKGRRNFDTFHLQTRTGVWKKMSDTSAWRQFRIRYVEDLRRRMELIEPWMAWHTGEMLKELGYPVEPARESDDSSSPHIHTVQVDGVPVRIEDGYCEVVIVIEGVIQPATIQSLLAGLQSMLVSMERTVERVVED